MQEKQRESDYGDSAGDFLAEELEARGMTQRALAAAMGRSPKVVNEIIGGTKAITAGTAPQLQTVLGISCLFSLNTQARYDLVQARTRVRSA